MSNVKRDINAKSQQSIVSKLLDVGQKTRTVRMLASNSQEDRHGDTIDPSGWKLDNFKRNPVILWAHDKHSPPIGKATDVGITARGLELTIEFATADVYPFADTIYNLFVNDFLNAGSVGFIPIRWEYRDDANGCGVDFKEQELIEYSIVPIPSLATSLALAKSAVDLAPLIERIKAAPDRFPDLRDALGVAAQNSAAPALKRRQLQIEVNRSRVSLA